ncbi:glycoside hydrolase [Coccomyxa subellipsoidea C-169]|uniref:Glycoside hydrolase n=1 Tax=Coccomyxa subellipsoidea (strain C-169) TaxID=574566 RepID=I0Z331_COCSC|nr:glycoside hydrolase [Coccomyxa subellipsoidea C-169]EIE25050.1 glycoside hydrolase [Coccomyxa subellipsoidea C-169]|eukprot:XP_005649594.1 glycoside hydrolase [Coccomyxa subellipsoidea C-169]
MSLNIFEIFAAGDQEPSSTQEISFTCKASSASCPAVPATSSTGPGDLAGKLQGLPLLQSIGNRTFNPQFKPIIVPPPLVKPADFYDARNDPKKYSCEVVVLPYLSFVLESNMSRFIPSARGRPLKWRAVLQLAVHNMLPVDLPPGWNITLQTSKYNYTDVYNARLLTYDARSNKATFQAWRPYLTLSKQENSIIKIMLVVEYSIAPQDLVPESVALNGAPCKVYFDTRQAATVKTRTQVDDKIVDQSIRRPGGHVSKEDIVAQFPWGTASPASPSGNQPISARDGILYGVDGNPVVLKGVNWFGFETGATMVAGLWAGYNSLTQDFATVVWRQKLLGFNAVRLPFSFQVLFNYGPTYLTDQCQAAGLGSIVQNVVPPGFGGAVEGSPSPYGSSCNVNVPNYSTYSRFLYVIKFYAANGFYVVLDNQFNLDTTAKDNPWQWLTWWKQLLNDVILDPQSKNRVMLDLLNEPDSQYFGWEQAGPLYLQAMDALYPISPTTLFLIEGSGQSWQGAMNWGDGFITDQNLINQRGMSNPNPFFTTLLSKPYLNNIVISPHYYPPSISKATSQFTGPNLWNRMSTSFGYLNKYGYGGHLFPIVIGESGSLYTDSNDIAMLSDMAKYLNNQGEANDGRHNPIPHLFWWAWNPNSADTGGLVSDPNWDTVLWNKVNWLIASINLSPWAFSGGFQGSASGEVASEQKPAPPPPPPPPPPRSPVMPSVSGSCTAQVYYGAPWNSIYVLPYMSIIRVTLKNTDTADIVPPYALQMWNPYYKYAAQPLNWEPSSMSNGAIDGNVTQPYAVLLAEGASYVNFNLLVGSTEADMLPWTVYLEGVSCKISRLELR